MDYTLWSVLAAAGALLMRVGMAVHAAGLVRCKNAASMISRHLVDACVTVLGVWAVGWAIASSGGAFFGVEWKALLGWKQAEGAGMWTLAAWSLVATGIVPGVLAERSRFWPSLAGAAALSTLVAPVLLLWSSGSGWLHRMSYVDIAGSGYLHLPGAVCGLIGAVAVGARSGKFNQDGSSTAIPGHSVPLAAGGALIMVAGFFLFIAGRGGGGSLSAVLVAMATAGLSSAVFSQMRYYKPDVHLICAGMLSGLVAISSGAPVVNGLGALTIGMLAGMLTPLAMLILDVKVRVDDPSGGVAVHGVGAVTGLLLTPLFNTMTSSFGDRLKSIGAHLLAVLVIIVLSAAVSWAAWMIAHRCSKIRASDADEFDGLDLAEHDINAYPDFQQTMIKSYHTREM